MITCTPAAAEQIQKQLQQRGHGAGLRIGVKKTGCSGLAYTLEFCDDIQPDDTTYESAGVQLIVSREALPYLLGTTIDYARKGLNYAFEFSNPNETARCGCGESFAV